MKVMREHQKADKRIKLLLEDRLVNANFNTEAGLLNEEKYEELEKWAADTYQFNEKFEVYTHTKRKAIKDPEKLAKAIKDAISKALADAGINDTELEVKFIKDW
jgi:ribosomal protein L22